jgi:hypothetical protein
MSLVTCRNAKPRRPSTTGRPTTVYTTTTIASVSTLTISPCEQCFSKASSAVLVTLPSYSSSFPLLLHPLDRNNMVKNISSELPDSPSVMSYEGSREQDIANSRIAELEALVRRLTAGNYALPVYSEPAGFRRYRRANGELVERATTLPGWENLLKAAEDYTEPFCNFLTNNPTVWHAVDYFEKKLQKAGFKKVSLLVVHTHYGF